MGEAPKFTPAVKVEDTKATKTTEVVDDLHKLPTTEEVLELARSNSAGIQFKNSLKYIQGGTNITLDRMIERFDIVLAELYAQGLKDGIEFSKKMALDLVKSGSPEAR